MPRKRGLRHVKSTVACAAGCAAFPFALHGHRGRDTHHCEQVPYPPPIPASSRGGSLDPVSFRVERDGWFCAHAGCHGLLRRARPGAQRGDHRRVHGGTMHSRLHASRVSLDARHPKHLPWTSHLGAVGDTTGAGRVCRITCDRERRNGSPRAISENRDDPRKRASGVRWLFCLERN